MSRARAVLLGFGLLSAVACGPTTTRPHVVLVTIDTLRADRLASYGHGIATPHADRLAREGALFENAFADSPWTTPSMASVLTGNYATLHGFRSTTIHQLQPENETLAEVLHGAGYATAAFVGSFPLDSIFQLDQGFDHYDDAFTRPITTLPDHELTPVRSVFLDSPEQQRFLQLSKTLNDSRREDAEVTDAALAWLAEHAADSAPFLLWVHYFGPHEKPNWLVPGQGRLAQHRSRYDTDVEAVDRELGRLLDALDRDGLTDDSLVVFHADHGESLGEQGLVDHGPLLNEASLRIPLVMRYPGVVAAGIRDEALARNVDIFPTVLEAVGVSNETPRSGESLLSRIRAGALPSLRRALRGGAVDDSRSVYLETFHPAHVAFAVPVQLPDGSEGKIGLVRRGIRTAEWKLVVTEPTALLDVSRGSLPEVPPELARRYAREELYHLAGGDGERRNVIARNRQVADRLRGLLKEHRASEAYPPPQPAMDVDEERRLRLESLGYGTR